MTLETLEMMLGGEDKKQNMKQIILLIKKKIRYMVNEDAGAARDFLDLVEILKMQKVRV